MNLFTITNSSAGSKRNLLSNITSPISNKKNIDHVSTPSQVKPNNSKVGNNNKKSNKNNEACAAAPLKKPKIN